MRVLPPHRLTDIATNDPRERTGESERLIGRVRRRRILIRSLIARMILEILI